MAENNYQPPYPTQNPMFTQTTPAPNTQAIPTPNIQTQPSQNFQAQTSPRLNENIQRNPSSAAEELDGTAFNGSMQRILSSQIGQYVVIEFLIGTQNIVYREGFLYSVGISYLILYDSQTEQYTICDLYAIKFVTFKDTRQQSSDARPVSTHIKR